jgi:hypothetical protein
MDKYNCPFGGCTHTRETTVLFDTHLAGDHGIEPEVAKELAEHYRALAQQMGAMSLPRLPSP